VTNRRLEIEVPPGEPAVVFRRLVDAPPELVFAVWTEPEHLRNWWGPRQFPSFAARYFYAQAGMEAGLRESHQRLDEWLEAIHNEN
jgi:hypothetical protein